MTGTGNPANAGRSRLDAGDDALRIGVQPQHRLQTRLGARGHTAGEHKVGIGRELVRERQPQFGAVGEPGKIELESDQRLQASKKAVETCGRQQPRLRGRRTRNRTGGRSHLDTRQREQAAVLGDDAAGELIEGADVGLDVRLGEFVGAEEHARTHGEVAVAVGAFASPGIR